MNFRKQIISVVLILVLIFLSSKIIVNAFENAAMNVLKSKKFNTFLINQIEHHIVTYAENINQYEDKKLVIKDSLKKIIKEWKPIFDEIDKELQN